jgi:putative acetyltransferase
MSAVEIIEYAPEYKEHFKALNLEWIERYFTVEDADRKALDDPEQYILQNGSYVFFARDGEEIVGTCALIKHNSETYELAKMGVTETARGKQIGKRLGLAVIEKAQSVGAKSIFLETNDKLQPALALYRNLGFVMHKPVKPSKYQRANVFMMLDLSAR